MSRPSTALGRLVVVWLRAAPTSVGIVAGVVLLTTFLATAGPLWFGQRASAAFPALLSTVSAGQSGLEFDQAGLIERGHAVAEPLSEVTAAGDVLHAEIPPSIVGALRPRIDVIDTQEQLAVDPPQQVTRLTLRIEPASADAITFFAGRAPTGHIDILVRPLRNVDDQWPIYEVALSRTTASALKVSIGDKLVLTPGENEGSFAGVEVVGLFDVIDQTDPRWFGDVSLVTPGIQRLTPELFAYHAVGLLSPDAYSTLGAAGAKPLTYRWRFPLDVASAASLDLDRVATDLAKLRAAHPFSGTGAVATPGLSTGLTPLLDLVRSQRTIAGTALVLASTGGMIASLGALALVAGALGRSRRETIQLARARGADLPRLVAIQFVESVILVAPAATVGISAAFLIVGGSPGGAIPGTIVALGAILLLARAGFFAARSSLASGRQRSRLVLDARDRRRVLDAAIVIVAVATAVATGSGPVADPTAPPDPARALGPGLLAIAGAVVILRVFDGVMTGLAWLLRRTRGFVTVHATRGLARGPRTHELPLVVLLVAVAAGVFATTVATTIDATQALAAATQTGADYRIEPVHVGGLPPDLDLDAIGEIGPTAIVGRDVGALQIGFTRQPVDVVGIDAVGYAAVTAGTPIAASLPAGFRETTPADGSATHPVPIVIPSSLASDTGLGVGSTVRLAISGGLATALVVDVGDPIPATAVGRGILAPLGALRSAFPDRAFGPTQIFLRGDAAARARLDAVIAPYSSNLRVLARNDVETSLRTAPLVDTMSTAFLGAEVIAGLYAAIVVGAAVAQTLTLRSAELSLLRALGLTGRRAVGIVVIELGSTIVVASVAGLALGLVTASLILPGLGVERFVGVAVAARPAVEPSGMLRALLAPAIASLAAVLLAARALGSSGVAGWIRSGET